MGSRVSTIGKVSGFTSIVPGPPEGSRGSTGWGHPSRRAPWAEVGGEPAPGGLVSPPSPPSAPRVGNPRGGGASTCLGGQVSPLGRRPPRRSHLLGLAPPWGPYIKRGVGGQPHPTPWRLPPLPATPPPLAEARRSSAGTLLHPPPRRRAAGSSSTSPSPCWIKKEETSC